MVRVPLSCVMLFGACLPALAQADVTANVQLPDLNPNLIHWIITLVGTLWAALLASRAFNRPAIPIADVPTAPRFMTSRNQYQLGSLMFVFFACGFFLMLVHLHRDVVGLLDLVPLPVTIPKEVIQAINNQSAPYLVVVSAMGVVYLYVLTKEAEWNLLLWMRDVIQRWISVPQLAGRIVNQIRISLRVPDDAVASVIAESSGIVKQDFYKAINTPDRVWAETCYMMWWLSRRHDAGEDATFFSADEVGFDNLLVEFQRVSLEMERWKSKPIVDLAIAELPKKINELRNRISRLIACYLIYRNGSKQQLCGDAHSFGIDLNDDPMQENPLRYWIIYAVVLIASVYIGVSASAVGYDLLAGNGLIFGQDPNRTAAWIMYSLCNYGLAILVILLLRMAARLMQIDSSHSHLVTYCWTFLVGYVLGPFGLAVAVHFFGEGNLPEMSIGVLYYRMLKWGLGPALVSVYISYYLDRMTFHDLPDINHSSKTLVWRLANSFGFAAVNVLVLLSPLLSLTAQPNAVWDSAKLRFVATGCTFSIAFGLALAAQFALRKVSGPTSAKSHKDLSAHRNITGHISVLARRFSGHRWGADAGALEPPLLAPSARSQSHQASSGRPASPWRGSAPRRR